MNKMQEMEEEVQEDHKGVCEVGGGQSADCDDGGDDEVMMMRRRRRRTTVCRNSRSGMRHRGLW